MSDIVITGSSLSDDNITIVKDSDIALARKEAQQYASDAAASATSASNSAGVSSLNATSASNSATSANTSRLSAQESESIALTQATVATTQAGIATTKASEASASASSASTSASTATTQAGIATTQATSASSSASSALTYMNAAEAAKNTAEASKNQAVSAMTDALAFRDGAEAAKNTALSAMNSASTYAAAASTSATNSEASYQNTLAIYGSTQDVQDAVNLSTANANTSISKANEASSSAISAASSATTATSAKDAIEAYVIPTEATYNPQLIDSKINAVAPYSGYTQVSKKLDNFVFKTDANFTYSVADKNRYVKFGDTVVDTYGPELVTNGDFSDGTTGWLSGSGGILNVVDGKLKISGNTGDGAFAGYQVISTEIGKIYSLKCGSIETVNSTFSFRVGSSSSIGDLVLVVNGESIDVTFKAVSIESHIWVYGTTDGGEVYVDNISVREIQTADFSNDIPEVTEVITDGSNTTSVAVNAGDYVVDGSELVTNGTFDSDTTGWNSGAGSILSVETSSLRITGDGVNAYPLASQNIFFISGQKYIVEFEIKEAGLGITIAGETLSPQTGAGYYYPNAIGKYTVSFTASSNVLRQIRLVAGSLASDTALFDNISVRRVSDTFRAIQTAPIGTALTNTTYFQDRTQIGVTNQVLSYHAYNTLTNAYEGIKTEVLFSDVSKEDLLNNDTWMSANGFSKVSKHLYSKGVYYVLPVGIWQSLNKGAYNPFLNPFGTARYVGLSASTLKYWYNLDYSASLSNSFTPQAYISSGVEGYSIGSGNINGGVITIPDSKFYDIVYPDQFIDVRQYAKIATPYEIELIRKDKEENGVEEVAFTIISKIRNVSESADSSTYTSYKFFNNALLDLGYNAYNDNVKFGVINSNGTVFQWDKISNTPNLNTSTFSNHIYFPDTFTGDLVVYATVTKPILSSGTKLSIDLIGNPDNYPQVLKDRLASGVGVVGVNPLLISDTGVSLIPTDPNTLDTYKLSSKNVSGNVTTIVSVDGGATYGAGARALDAITNTINQYTLATTFLVAPYTSKNQPYIQTAPKPVVEVEPKVIATNSHSLYKGALVGNQVAGKIQVGNGANGYESKVLENAEPYITDAIRVHLGNTLDIVTGKKYILMDGFINHGKIVQRTGTTATNFTPSVDWVTDIGGTYTLIGWITEAVPTHQTLALDNANSPAAKYFNTLAEDNNNTYAQVFGEEITYDGANTWGDGDFTQLTNGTLPDVNGGSDVRTFCGLLPLNIGVK